MEAKWMISLLQPTTRMPHRIIELRNAAAKIMITTRPIWDVANYIIDFTSFRADGRECRLRGSREIIERALEIDKQFLDTSTDPPSDWMYESVFTDEDPHLVWNKSYHRFRHDWAPPIWNGMRTCRIML